MEKSLKRTRRLAVIAVFAVIAVAAFGFAAANTVDESGAGDGSGVISGYNVSNIAYNLQASDPRYLASVSFSTTPIGGNGSATEAAVSFDGGTTWATCSGGPAFVCNLPADTFDVSSAADLRVVAVQ